MSVRSLQVLEVGYPSSFAGGSGARQNGKIKTYGWSKLFCSTDSDCSCIAVVTKLSPPCDVVILIKAQTDSGDQGLPLHSKKKGCQM